MPIVKMPDGTQVRFPDEMPKEQIRGLILQKFPDAGNPAPQQQPNDPNAQAVDAGLPVADPNVPGANGNSPSPAFQNALAQLHAASSGIQQAPQEDTDRNVRANLEASKIQQMQGDKGLMGRAAEAIPGGATGGFADEIYSGTIGGVARMLRDQVGYGEAYKREQALAAAQKRKRGDAANLIGDVAGGLALGAGATAGPLTMTSGGTVAAARPAWGGLTLTGRATGGLGKTAAAIGEGGAYGGLYGAGNASEGHRLEEGAKGAAIGAATGGLLEGAGNVASRIVSKAKNPSVMTPTIDELAQATDDLYARSRNAGVTIKPAAFDNLANNMELAAGRLNDKLRPATAGVVDDVMARKGKNISLEELDELRQEVGDAMSGAKRQDIRTLTRMKKIIDHFSDNVKPGDITGDIRGFELIKEGRKLAARKAKAETIAEVVEKAKNTVSGFENGLVIQLRKIADDKGKLSRFSQEEQKLIKGIVRRTSGRGLLRAVGHLSPQSPLGAAIMGALGIGSGVVPAALVAGTGMAARAGADVITRGKLGTLQSAVANGALPQLPQLPNYLRPAIGATTAGATGLLPRSAQPNR